jgi:hypothetical protein
VRTVLARSDALLIPSSHPAGTSKRSKVECWQQRVLSTCYPQPARASRKLHSKMSLLFITFSISTIYIISAGAQHLPDSNIGLRGRGIEQHLDLVEKLPSRTSSRQLTLYQDYLEAKAQGDMEPFLPEEGPYGMWRNMWTNSVAMCTVMKDENLTDIREWIMYHR